MILVEETQDLFRMNKRHFTLGYDLDLRKDILEAKNAIKSMRNYTILHRIRYLAFPIIVYDFDKDKYNQMKEIVEEEFKNIEVDINMLLLYTKDTKWQ